MTLKEHSPIPDGDHDPAVPRASLDPDPETMRQLGYELIDRVVDHLATLLRAARGPARNTRSVHGAG